jgi:Mg-chelatase subunit ChlD
VKVDSTTHRTVAVPSAAAGVSVRLAVSLKGPQGPALLEVDDGGRRTAVAVDVQRHDGVPDAALVVPQDLHDELGLGDGGRWTLRQRPAVRASGLVLEPATVREPDRMTREIAAGGLAGALLTPAPGGWEPLVIGGSTYEIKEVRGANRDAIVRIGPETSVEIFAPGARAGVDMVILADVSESMDVADVPKPSGGYVKRIDVLKRSLRALLAVRAAALGPASQVALLAFDSKARTRFPNAGGMATLDAASPKAVTESFRKAVDQLAPRPGSHTDIQRALHAAAELLNRHGRPANERVIVLVSDGADCPPRRPEDTGRVFGALEEPVSLMEHLHRDMRVRLHAVGISTEEWFHRRCEPNARLVPDHRLLQKLLLAAGGGRPTIGGVDDVGDYFSEVGTGLRYPVTGKLTALPALRLDKKALQKLTVRRPSGPDRDKLADEFAGLVRSVNELSQRALGGALFQRGVLPQVEYLLLREVPGDTAEFTRQLTTHLRRLSPLPPDAGQTPCVREWTALMKRLNQALVAERDLGEVSRLCECPSREIPDVAVAVLATLCRQLRDVDRGLGKLPPRSAGVPAARRPVDAGGAVRALERTGGRSFLP